MRAQFHSTRTLTDPYLAAHVPIIGIDIWEHSFYLQYKNVKADVSSHVLWCAHS